MSRPQAEALANAEAFFELVLRPLASGSEIRSAEGGWKSSAWRRATFVCGDHAKLVRRAAEEMRCFRRTRYLWDDPVEAARWVVEEKHGAEAQVPTYTAGGAEPQSSVAVRLTDTFGALLSCAALPSFAVSSPQRGTLHAVWLLTEGVSRPFGGSLAGRIARRVDGRPTPLIPVPGTSDYELIVVSGAAYGFDELEDSFKRMPTARRRQRS